MRINNQEQALQYVCSHNEGFVSDLKDHLEPEVIRDFEFVGFIKRGETSDGTATWRIMGLGKEFFASIYGKPTFSEKLKGYFLRYVLRIR